jgi:hypothetical protein
MLGEIPMTRMSGCLVAAILCASCESSSEIGAFVRDNGYTDPKPPSNLLEPGTIVFQKSTKPLTYGIACTPQSAFGDGIAAAVKKAAAANASVVAKMQGKFKLDAGYQQQVRASVGAGYVKDIFLDFSNVELLSLPVNEVFERVADRKPGCVKAIEFLTRSGRPISLVIEALKANVLYTVSFQSNIAAEAKVQAVQNLAVQLGADASSATQSTLKGTGLFWGLRDDASLAAVQPGDRATRGPSVRLIPPQTAIIDPTLPEE